MELHAIGDDDWSGIRASRSASTTNAVRGALAALLCALAALLAAPVSSHAATSACRQVRGDSGVTALAVTATRTTCRTARELATSYLDTGATRLEDIAGRTWTCRTRLVPDEGTRVRCAHGRSVVTFRLRS